jgi:hypothetical protein
LAPPLRTRSCNPARLLLELRHHRSSCHCRSVVPIFVTTS